MKNRKIRIAILFGGKSAEHEVSIQSAKNIAQALDKDKYDIVLIGIDKKGRWLLGGDAKLLLGKKNSNLVKLNSTAQEVTLSPQGGGGLVPVSRAGGASTRRIARPIDVVFPVLHGPFGEDGTVQGLLKLAGVPFVGAGVLGSAVGMDKDVMKRLLKEAKLPVAKFLVVKECELKKINFEKTRRELGLPVFIKPANLGSSVGVSKVSKKDEFKVALKEAFKYDSKVLIEEYIDGREIECSVLGNEKPIASVPGEVIPNHEFYSYEAKYIDENGAVLKIPASLPKKLIKRIQELAVKTFTVLACEGMARVDFFLAKDKRIFINEINTIPGFTNISMYPKLWEASGISQSELVDRLIQLAFERFSRENRLKTSYAG
jgi:D-alanine-D-alanine ligase